MEVRRIFPVELKLSFETIFRIVESVNLVHPQGLLIKGVKSQRKADEKAKKEDENFLSSYFVLWSHVDVHTLASLSRNAKD